MQAGEKMKDYYAILGIKENADAQEIKKAYRKLVKIYHPDVVKEDKEKTRRMYAIQEAYQCLSKEESRKKYDESRRKQAEKFAGHSKAGQEKQNCQSSFTASSPFEQFFGFQAGKGMETYRSKSSGVKPTPGKVQTNALFSAFFEIKNGSNTGKKGGVR